MNRPEAPLEVSAPLAHRLAPSLCRKNPATGESCAWRHGLWQILRMMGLGTTPSLHAEFLLGALAAHAISGHRPRVLVSGAADHAMLEHVISALGEQAPAVTVVDLCETPLYFNRWYAERVGCDVRTIQDDVLEFSDPDRYDVICTHALLGELAPAARVRLASNWRELLRPGGVAITVNRLRPDAGDEPIRFSARQAKEFRETVAERADSLRDILHADPAELAREAELYALRMTMYPVHTRDELVGLFAAAGFASVQCTIASSKPGTLRGAAVPTVPGGSEYACIIAAR
jgi:SAM-dependent methyltransferase